MNKCKKIIAFLLAVLFVLPLGVLGVLAEDAATEPTNLITADNIKEAVVSNPNAYSDSAEEIARLFDGQKYGLSPMTSSGNGSGNGAYRIAFNEAITLNKFVTYRTEQELWMVSGDWAIDVKLTTGEWIRVAEIHDEYGTNVEFVTDEDGNVLVYEDLGITNVVANHDVAYYTRTFTFPTVTASEIRVGYRTGKTKSDGSTVGGSQHFVEFEAYLDDTVTKYTGVEGAATSADTILNSDLGNLQALGTPSANAILGSYPATNLNDGAGIASNAGSITFGQQAITSYSSSGIAYFQIAFAEEKTINQVAIYTAPDQLTSRPNDYALDVKTTDGVWHRVAEIHNKAATGAYDDHIRTFNFAPMSAVAVRVSANNKRNSSGNFQVSEMVVKYNPSVTADVYTGTTKDTDDTYNIPELKSDNLALSSTITSSNTTQFYTENYPVDVAIDGKGIASTAQNVSDAIIDFALNNKTVGYYELNMSTPVPVNNVIVYKSQTEMDRFPHDFAVDVKTSDGYWVRVAEMHNVTPSTSWADGSRNFKFETVDNVVSVRVSANKVRGGYSIFRATEIAVYNDPTIVEADYTGAAKAESSEYDIPEYLSDNFALNGDASTNKELSGWDVERLTNGTATGNANIAISSFENNLSWFQANFKAARTINQVTVHHSFQTDAIPQDFAIDVKVNGATTWTRVAEAHNVTRASVINYYFAEVEDVVAVRITAHKVRNTSGNFAVGELEAYYNGNITEADYTGIATANDAVIPYTLSSNYAASATATALSADETYPIANINDGNKAYNSDLAGTALNKEKGYFEFEFATATTVNQVVLYLSDDQFATNPNDFAIDVQLEDGTWVRKVATYNIANLTDWGANARTFSFQAVEAVKVRVSFSAKRKIDANSYTHVYFTEIEIFNNPNVTANDYTGIAIADDWKYDILAVDHVVADQNGDGKVDGNDLIVSKKILLSVESEALEADVNGDYVINVLDFIATSKSIVTE